jgi:uncharacterized membrane protein
MKLHIIYQKGINMPSAFLGYMGIYFKSLVLAAAMILASLFFIGNYYMVLYDDYFFATNFENHSSGSISDASNVRAYLLGQGTLASNLFSYEEVVHLSDVKEVMSDIHKLSYFFVILFLSLLLLLAKSSNSWSKFSNDIKYIFFIASIVVVSVTLLAVFVSKNFAYFFSSFHSLFFEDGTWFFPEGSALITFFPESFFLDFFRRVVISSFLQAAALILLIIPSIGIFTAFKHKIMPSRLR